ncbi:MAG: indole-3-glycerol phosphate synthase TrpC [Robiginitomaculum sp.]|nr:indole-3-glycerol phosphate synthase TrpC [Robiginitomaculum sp.]MDQ7077191.1 indole-3-glycerol phosphate synthase TrpC [Robiginitomaculum sp.]
MSILERILDTKREEIAAGKTTTSMQDLLGRVQSCTLPRGFVQALKSPPTGTSIALIAEIKRASPSKGLIREDFDPASLARAYQDGGATCLSVLTDREYFQGQNAFLGEARAACTLPVLRKDFIIDPWQVVQSRALGADCILLIMAALETALANELASLAQDLGMDVLVEVHNATEMEAALTLPVRLIGINNRNLSTFETSLSVTEDLSRDLPEGLFLVSESGIYTAEDIARVKAAGASAVLVGESLMRQDDVEQATRTLLA